MHSTARKTTVRTRIPRRSSLSSDSRPSMGPLGSAPDLRHSLRPPMGRRSSSLSHLDGRPSLSQAKRPAAKDYRPLNDREYQQECAHRLHAFLASHGHACQITVQQILRMSNKQFADCFVFLLNFLDPTFKLGPRVEDSIMTVLQQLNYPFSVSKSMLQAIGSRLPLALGILTWLLAVVEYGESIDIFEHLFPDDAAINRDCGQVIGSRLSKLVQYGLTPHGSSPDASTDDRFLRQLVEEAYGPLESVDELRKDLERLENEVQKREAEKAEYLEWLQTISNNMASTEQLEGFIQDFDQFFAAKKNALEDLKCSNAAKEVELEALKKELQNERAILDEQRQRGEDKESLENLLKEAQASLAHAQQQYEAQREEQRELEIKWSVLLSKKRDDIAEIERLHSEAPRKLAGLPRHVAGTLKNFQIDKDSTLEDLQQQCAILDNALDTVQQVRTKTIAATRNESELAEKYRAARCEAERELQTEKEIFAEALAAHDKVKQGLLRQIDDKKAQYAQIQKDLVTARTQVVATCADDSLLSLQQSVAAARAECKQSEVQLEAMKVKCDKHIEEVKIMIKEKKESLAKSFKRLQAISKPK